MYMYSLNLQERKAPPINRVEDVATPHGAEINSFWICFEEHILQMERIENIELIF